MDQFGAIQVKNIVSNRVAQIQGYAQPSQWFHVPGTENPADMISRGISPSEISNNSLWFNGPNWLSLNKEYWPKFEELNFNDQDIPEVKTNTISLPTTNKTLDESFITRFSSFRTLVYVIVYVFRFYNLCKKNIDLEQPSCISLQEINQATLAIVRLVQRIYFAKEIHCLESSQKISRKSKLVALNPLLDESGILRVGGRIENSPVSFDHKHPMLLPANHPLSYLITSYTHLKYLHAGPQLTLSLIRRKYWPLNGRNMIRQTIRKCIDCCKASPVTMTQKMADLPAKRITPTRPFNVCAVDFAGPYLIKDSKVRNKKFLKAYVCIFVCFVTKAVHIELASELSTENFLNVFKRFIARRGLISEIVSDNATNFVGADKALKNFIYRCDDPIFKKYLLDNQIVWKFIPPRTPHFNGLVEAAVRQTKFHLKRVLNDIKLTYEDFYSLLVQVESILNSRPLYPLTEDPESLEVLTPGHFLVGGPLMAIPESLYPDARHTKVNLYRHLSYLVQQFWRKWQRDYLHTLQQRTKWQFDVQNPPLVGQLVLLKEDNLPPLKWKMGRIVELHPGQDNLVRVVAVKTTESIFKRAITSLCLLPVET